ncbi:MAG: cyclodeaminase/cyclohydrolase family protein [Planctomycetia bacterium]|nr:cyclodeaminase/cyclohydrolase family protein [Planctomycetia bacterium]
MDYRTEPLMKYFEDASSAKATPGGGSVAALAGALASTMASMAGEFTVGKEKFKNVEPQVRDILSALASERESLVELAHRDMDAYLTIMSAYRLPKDTDDEKEKRSEAIDRATRDSLKLVKEVMARCRSVVELASGLVGIANPNLLSDVAVAAELALGAHQAAVINVMVNLHGLKDEALVHETLEEIAESEGKAGGLAAETTEIVRKHLTGEEV